MSTITIPAPFPLDTDQREALRLAADALRSARTALTAAKEAALPAITAWHEAVTVEYPDDATFGAWMAAGMEQLSDDGWAVKELAEVLGLIVEPETDS